MSHILGLKFRDSGQIYYFDSGAFVVNTFDRVIVNTDQGMALAKVVLVLDEPPEDFEGGEIKPIYRLASEEDIVQEKENEALGKEAFEYCRKCVIEHKLDMKLVDVDVFFDRCKIVFYFTAPNRIDFRELVKDLVRTYRTRIELRQIGVRHETQMTGAVGNCGQLCCCRRFLRKFAPVTIKMAKEQNLFLNPTKISGICGRLLCCLAYEQDNYEQFHAKCPRVGKRYITERGGMKVLRANFFRDSLSVLPDGGEEEEISIDEWTDLEPQRPDPNQQQQQQQQQQQRPENKPRKDKPRKAKDGSDDEPGGADTSSEEPKAAKAKEETQAEAAEPAQAKPERKKRDQKRGRRGAKGRKRDKSDEQQGESPANGGGDKASESREKPQETAMPAGEVVQSEKGPTQNLPAVKTKGTFGISGLGAQPAKPQQSEEEQGKAPVEEKAAKAEQKEAKPEGPIDQQTGDATAEKDAQDGSGKSKKGKGRSRSSRRRPSRRSGRGRGGNKGGGESGSASKDSGESAGSGNARPSGDSKSSGSPAGGGEPGSAGGSEKSGSAQRKSRPRRRRRKPKQEKPKE